MNKFAGLKCLTETKLQILYDSVYHTCYHMVEKGCQMVLTLAAYIVGPIIFLNLPPALQIYWNVLSLSFSE